MSKWLLFVLSWQFTLLAICFYKIVLEFIYVFHQKIIFVWETRDNENIAHLMVI